MRFAFILSVAKKAEFGYTEMYYKNWRESMKTHDFYYKTKDFWYEHSEQPMKTSDFWYESNLTWF